MTDAPLVSVIIPAYNAEAFVAEAIESALAQSYRPLEIIVADDGSRDATADRVRAFGEPVRYLHQENQGPAAARNLALKNARGVYAAFLDADDLWHPEKLRVQVEAMESMPGVGLLAAQEGGPEAMGRPLPEARPLRRIPFGSFYFGNRIMTSSIIIRRVCLETTGLFDPSFFGPEDWDLWLRFAHDFGIAEMRAPLAFHREVEASVQGNPERMRDNVLRVLAKAERTWPAEIGASMRLRARSLIDFRTAWQHSAQGRQARGMVRLLQSLARWPLPFPRGLLKMPLGRARLLVRLPLRALAALFSR